MTIMPRRLAALLTLALAGACGGPALVPSVSPSAPIPAAAPPAAAPALRTALPTRVASTTWHVQSVATVRISSDDSDKRPDEQRVESRALVSWSAERQPHGALRATGQVDSFSVRTSFDASRGTQMPAMPAMILVEGTLDSALARVATRPPLANECDRPEAGAAALARELLIRVPDGAARGDRWRDSVVTLVCRSGVPMTVHTSIISTLETLDPDRLVLRRELSTRMEGQGGSSFRSLTLSGTGTGMQRVEISPQRGTVERLQGSGALVLVATERLPGNISRNQRIEQRTELTATRAR